MIESFIYRILEPFLIEEGIRRGYDQFTTISLSGRANDVSMAIAYEPARNDAKYLIERARTKDNSPTEERVLYNTIVHNGKFKEME